MRRLFVFLLIAFVGIMFAGMAVWYVWKDRKVVMEDTPAGISMSADDFILDFKKDGPGADTRYDNQVIEVSGTLRESESDAAGNVNLFLSTEAGTVQCAFSGAHNQLAASLAKGSTVKVKGYYAGYDAEDLLLGLVIKLNNCVLTGDQ